MHIVLAKFSSKYEILIKHGFANSMEIKELSRIAQQEEKITALVKQAKE
jgi:hypothetical protein